MLQSVQTSEIEEIKNGLNRLGLILSDIELNELDQKNVVFLEEIELSKLGSVFILASAVSAFFLGTTKRKVVFQDLPQGVRDSASGSGIPVYCWNFDSSQKRCLYLTFVDGKPAVCIY